MLALIQKRDDPSEIRALKDSYLPVYREQERIYKTYCEQKYKVVNEIQDAHQLRDYMEDNDIIAGIDDDHFHVLVKKFNHIIASDIKSMVIAKVFYEHQDPFLASF